MGELLGVCRPHCAPRPTAAQCTARAFLLLLALVLTCTGLAVLAVYLSGREGAGSQREETAAVWGWEDRVLRGWRAV